MSKSEYSVSIPENLANAQTVLWVHASDADEVRFIKFVDLQMLHELLFNNYETYTLQFHIQNI